MKTQLELLFIYSLFSIIAPDLLQVVFTYINVKPTSRDKHSVDVAAADCTLKL